MKLAGKVDLLSRVGREEPQNGALWPNAAEVVYGRPSKSHDPANRYHLGPKS